jgi:hypothetical protein
MKLSLILIMLLILINLVSAEIIFSDNPDNPLIMGPASQETAIPNNEPGGGFFDYSFNISKAKKSATNQFFYIELNLKKDLLKTKEDLVALIKFENFENSSYLTVLTYQILDYNKNVIHKEKDVVLLEKDTIVTKTFSNLNLKKGNYYLLVTVFYDGNTHELVETFAVEPLSPKEFVIYILNNKLTEAGIISLLIIGFFLYSFLLRKLKLKRRRSRN